MAVLGVLGNATSSDKITRFQTGCYVSASEACWRIFDFPVHGRHPAVIPLAVHLDGVAKYQSTIPLQWHTVDSEESYAQLPQAIAKDLMFFCH